MTLLRTTKRRPLELVAACMDHRGTEGMHIAVTISTPNGMQRELFECGPTPYGIVAAIRRMADWLEREHVKSAEVA